MEKAYDFFIAYNNADKGRAVALFELLKSINPELKVFMDCSDERPLETHDEWRETVLREIEKSQHLIFISSSVDYMKEGNGWVYEEVSLFNNLKKRNESDENASYFGILFGSFDLEHELYDDPIRGREYLSLYGNVDICILPEDEPLSSFANIIERKVSQCL